MKTVKCPCCNNKSLYSLWEEVINEDLSICPVCESECFKEDIN